MRYLPDRRLKLLASLEALHITPAQSHRHASLSETSSDSLRAIPDASFSSLTPEQLVLCAQVVDTALFKSYLAVRPGLLGPLCRRDNWYEVAEVEEMLAARGVSILWFYWLDKPTRHSIRNFLNLLTYTTSEKCTLELWNSFASEFVGFCTFDPNSYPVD